ncbi:MAG TPA: hypothetical protein VI248_08110, partial [Kineosporiaceae bacterium]
TAAAAVRPAAPPDLAPSAPPVAERASARVARELGRGAPSDVWTPVPVPPPTYTLKPAVPRPEPPPLQVTPTLPPRPAEPATAGSAARVTQPSADDRSFADDLDLDAVLARRRAVNG